MATVSQGEHKLERAATFEAGDQEEDRSGREQNKSTEESLKASIARYKNGIDKGHAHRQERAPSLRHTRLRFALSCQLSADAGSGGFLGTTHAHRLRRQSSGSPFILSGRAGLGQNKFGLYSAPRARQMPTQRACLVKEAMRRQRKHMHSEPSRADKGSRCRVPPANRSVVSSAVFGVAEAFGARTSHWRRAVAAVTFPDHTNRRR
jgi:hypothetical protein